jgi:hypothetical protein
MIRCIAEIITILYAYFNVKRFDLLYYGCKRKEVPDRYTA